MAGTAKIAVRLRHIRMILPKESQAGTERLIKHLLRLIRKSCGVVKAAEIVVYGRN